MKELLTNTNLSHYRIAKKIGAGGMGEVFLAEDTRLDRKVALKILPPEFAEDKERMNRFIREAKSASGLNHPNIITIHEIGESDGIHYIATEFIEGETLHDRLKEKNLSLKSTLDIAVQIVSALQAAHVANIIHRDIKPDNVMIRADGLVKILDFGIAKLSEQKIESIDAEAATAIKAPSTNPGVIIGTANYMSPEQARGKEIDARSDIFSFGLVLYEMLSGRRAFAGENALEIISSILKDEPQPINQLQPALPREIERIVSKTLRKDRDERYQTARGLLTDLKDAKQELEFQDKLERTSAPNAEDTKTQMMSAQTTDAPQSATSSAEFITGEVKKHKIGVALALLMVLALIGAGSWFFFNRAAIGNKQIESIAVMPFVNESGNADIDYLSDGMTETLISSLSQLPNLNIKPRSLVFRYKGREADSQTIGKDLNVQAVLIGRVVQRGADLSLFVELIDVASTKVIWSRQYNRKQNEIVSLQSEIARDISSKLKTGITNEEEKKITRNFTENPEAYRLFLRGNSLSYRRKSKDARAAIEAYEQAIALDPNYALAYAGLSGAHVFMVIYGGAPPLEEFPKARAAALKALELDSTVSSAHTALAAVSLFQDRDFNAMERETQRALELSPNDANAHRQNGLRLAWMGRFDEALTSHRRSLEIEPMSLVTIINYAWSLFYAGRIAESDAQLKVAQELDPNFWFADYRMFVSSRAKGDYDDAVEHLARAHELRDEPETAKFIRAAFVKGGWRGFIERALSAPEGSKMMAYELATFAAEVGEKDKAFALLGEAYDKHDQFILFMKIDPFMNPLRGDPRFEELLKKLGFPQ
ncbi:MAG TPA: protein kinase [Pyrinomonadaceae bacterium]|jgi:serine/threonine-protein kinase